MAFEAAAREVEFFGVGFYLRSGYMRIDFGSAHQWGERLCGLRGAVGFRPFR